ncbi:large conductance mechanosensitive channel protein MscL [Cellulosimicrobium funkei]|uniref:Large-conductance mechanosensitive channel n=1 Tax=Cellulosimicrobium funkei TaxID=264251 RepID=A0A4Y8QZS4_9MICO|nr:large conductance mechanosensitive channel protein MscL [Cellulosimicrobium funkei]TFF06585.1 large conductance mechanosensitive channel protein MscL [Cellulosimicrobium funkei]TGA70753.1 large conductance mechanosensitive channel protein MscL [Cellulosimicrobium terreum]
MKGVFQGFKEFVLRGNAIDLAVGVVIGAAFSGVVTAIVEDFINPLIGAIFGKPDLTGLWDITLRAGNEAKDIPPSVISVGGVLNAILQFLIIAVALYFVIVLPMNKLAERRKKDEEPEPEAPAEDVRVLQEIRDLLAAQAGSGPGTAPGGTAPGGPTPGGPTPPQHL